MKQRKNKIPQPKSESVSRIPESITLIPYSFAPEGKSFNISFSFYNDRECEIDLLSGSHGKRVLKDLRVIGKSHARTLQSNNIKTKPVSNAGEYSRLFSTLPRGVDSLKEHISSGTSRIFYFYAGQELYVVAIKENHYRVS